MMYSNQIKRFTLLTEDENEGPKWTVTYYLGENELDDSFELEEDSYIEVIMQGVDFEEVSKYAEQYLRKMKLEEDTATKWQHAEIISIELFS